MAKLSLYLLISCSYLMDFNYLRINHLGLTSYPLTEEGESPTQNQQDHFN